MRLRKGIIRHIFSRLAKHSSAVKVGKQKISSGKHTLVCVIGDQAGEAFLGGLFVSYVVSEPSIW
jgi:hypothetical protein